MLQRSSTVLYSLSLLLRLSSVASLLPLLQVSLRPLVSSRERVRMSVPGGGSPSLLLDSCGVNCLRPRAPAACSLLLRL